MKAYYNQRAAEYESIYYRDDPVRQAEQREMAAVISDVFKNRQVLEIACGTGFWTQVLDQVADSITGLDASEETLQIAQSKGLMRSNFIVGDAYTLNQVPGTFDAALANFWFSHVPKSQVNAFIRGLHAKLKPGSLVFMADNVYIEGVGGKLISKATEVDTYKIRTLKDGSTYEVLKNYYTEDELLEIFKPYSKHLSIHLGTCFWWIIYKTG